MIVVSVVVAGCSSLLTVSGVPRPAHRFSAVEQTAPLGRPLQRPRKGIQPIAIAVAAAAHITATTATTATAADPGVCESFGVGGPWRVEKQRLSWDILHTWQDAAEEAGLPKRDADFYHSAVEGSGMFQVNQRNGWRLSAHRAFLKPVMKQRPNLTVLTNAQVSEEGGSGMPPSFASST